MQIIPQMVPAALYPNAAIAAVYKKRAFLSGGRSEDVLVIETNPYGKAESVGGFDDVLSDLLLDLGEIRSEAEKLVGHVDRIDIKVFNPVPVQVWQEANA